MRLSSRRSQTILLITVVAIVVPTLALAGPHIRWDQCFSEPGAVVNKNFACDTNTGSERLTVSCWSPDTMSFVTGYEFQVEVTSAGTSFPAWWQFKNTGSCRQLSLIMNTVRDGSWSGCPAISPDENGAIAAYQIRFPTTMRIFGAAGVPPSAPFDIDPADGEMFLFNLTINHAKTVGSGACAGCTTPVCIGIEKVKYTNGTRFKSYTGSKNHDNDWFVSWQGGAGVSSPLGVGCPAAVPVRAASWGAIKTLYR